VYGGKKAQVNESKMLPTRKMGLDEEI
jgi:hypothetical protein